MTDPTTLSADPSAREILDDDALWTGMIPGQDADAEAPEPVAATADPAPADPETLELDADADAETVEVAPDEAAPEADAAEGEPEPEAAPEAEPEKPRPITAFAVYDAEGEVELPPIELEFKAHGETRRMPLDKVVRLAQSGFYNEQLQQEIKTTRAERSEWEDRVAQAEEFARRQAALNRAMLEDENAYLQRRAEYEQMNAPEQRAARAEAEARAERDRRERLEWDRQAQTFMSETVSPKVAALLAQYPTVKETEVIGWLLPELRPIEDRRTGAVPPARYGDVRKLLDNDLTAWMAEIHTQRTATAQATAQKRALAIRKAKVEAHKAKQTLAKAVTPARPGSIGKSIPKAQRDQMSAQDFVDAQFAALGGTAGA